jgi:peptidoglycan hydrolase CwlO-like protein
MFFGKSKWQKSIEGKLDNLITLFNEALKGANNIMESIDDLKNDITTLIANVTAEGNTVQAAVTAIKGLTDQQAVLSKELADAIAANDPAAIQAAADAIKAQNDLIVSQTAALAAAIPATPPAA